MDKEKRSKAWCHPWGSHRAIGDYEWEKWDRNIREPFPRPSVPTNLFPFLSSPRAKKSGGKGEMGRISDERDQYKKKREE